MCILYIYPVGDCSDCLPLLGSKSQRKILEGFGREEVVGGGGWVENGYLGILL
jgi:hypothetical protein